MPKLIQKSGYIKSGGGAKNYMSYIATRDGVEIISDRSQGEQYLSYIAQRPRSHGLFSDADGVDLNGTMKEIQSHDGPVWTIIYSLKREDAARLGFDSAKNWRDVLRSKQLELAAAMKISPKNFRWCAAFHDEATHPHVHMMIWSADPKEGHLTKQGIEKMRSAVTNEIFQDELLELYQAKDVSYKEVVEEAQRSMRQLIGEMGSTLTASPVIEKMISGLAAELGGVKGKKVYGYLKKSLKEKVDAIVDELAKVPSVAKCYEAWNVLRDQVESYYKDKQREHLPLSRQKEFRAIKNMVIREAERVRLGEHKQMQDEVVSRLTASAAQGNEQAQVFLDRWVSKGRPPVMLSITRLLHHLSRVFQDNIQSKDAASMIQNIDRKLRQRIREKKIAMGHKPDDHEEYQGSTMSM